MDDDAVYTYIALIVPAWSNQASQCRIAMTADPDVTKKNALDMYRAYVGTWHEVGAMNSEGSIVSLDDVGNLRDVLADYGLRGGLAVEFQATREQFFNRRNA